MASDRRGRDSDSAHPAMFSEAAANNCGSSYDGIVTWTDFVAPIGSTTGEADRYCSDLRSISPEADCTNTEAAYAAVFVAARAMGIAGVDLTRDKFALALDSSSFELGHTGGPLA